MKRRFKWRPERGGALDTLRVLGAGQRFLRETVLKREDFKALKEEKTGKGREDDTLK